jgi:hypothetical protein
MKKPGEAVFPYFAWNIEMFKRLMASKPNDTPQATQAIANHKQTYNISARCIGQFFQTPMFIAVRRS